VEFFEGRSGVASLHGRDKVTEDDLQDCFRVGLDCLADYRKRIFLAIVEGQGLETLPIPKTMRSRALEELEALHVLRQSKQKEYELDPKIADLWNKAGVKGLP
jgi:hypothetical protein